MSNIFVVFLSIGVCLTAAQWMPYLEQQNISPYSHPMADQLIVPKDSTKIPIILLLKAKRAKSLSADTSPETVVRHRAEADQQLSINEWMGMPHMSSDSMVSQHMSEAEYGLSVEPDSEASEDDEVAVKGRGGEQIKWPGLKTKKNGVTAEQLASISHLFPKLAAMSTSNVDLADMANKNGGALFEDALKKFASNLTDLEHRNSDDKDKDTDEQEETENSSESSIDSQSSSSGEVLKSGQTESIDKNENTSEKSLETFSAEQRDNQLKSGFLAPQKSRPFVNERNGIRVPVKSELNEQKSEPQIQTITGQPSHKGWVPIKSKHKPKRKPSKPVSIHRIDAPQQMHFPSEPSPMNGQYLYHNNERHIFGLPEPLNSIATAEPAPHMFRPRHFPHSYIPFDTKHSISHLPYHKYTSYLTDSPELSPHSLSMMEMTADANKPQHMEPIKNEESSALGADKHKDVIEEKEQMIDNKHVIGDKHIVEHEKHAIHGLGGDELLGQHMTCCDILHGQHGHNLHEHHNGHNLHEHNGHHHVIDEEVIKPDFDDDKVIANMGIHNYKQEYPIHFGNNFRPFHQQYPQSLFHKKKCQHEFPTTFPPTTYPPTYWPPKVYRRPVYRPKFFYKPLLFG